jgi:hypothetical protein
MSISPTLHSANYSQKSFLFLIEIHLKVSISFGEMRSGSPICCPFSTVLEPKSYRTICHKIVRSFVEWEELYWIVRTVNYFLPHAMPEFDHF